MGNWRILISAVCFLALQTGNPTLGNVRTKRQDGGGTGSTVANFIGQLTSLINANGGLGNVLQGGGQQGGYPQQPGVQGGVQGEAYPYPPPFPYPPPPLPYPPPEGYPVPVPIPIPYPPPQGGFFPPPQGGIPGQEGAGGIQQGQYPYPPPPPPPYPPFYPPGPYGTRPGFLAALSSISSYDDLKCVPRLLCEVTSGGRPGGYDGKQSSILPFASKDSLIALLTVLNYVDDSPLLGFGRAALLGYTARGDQRACLNAFPTCPRDADALVDYLNNHNGGFFRFFNNQFGLGAQQQYAPQYPVSQYPGYGYQQYPQGQHPYQFDTSYYQQKPQRPYRKQKLNQGVYASGYDYYQQGRIQTKPGYSTKYGGGSDGSLYYSKQDEKTLVFPGETRRGTRGGKRLHFPREQRLIEGGVGVVPLEGPETRFPDRTGTGELQLDLDAFGGYQGVHYASEGPSSFFTNQNSYNIGGIKFRDQRSIKFPWDR